MAETTARTVLPQLGKGVGDWKPDGLLVHHVNRMILIIEFKPGMREGDYQSQELDRTIKSQQYQELTLATLNLGEGWKITRHTFVMVVKGTMDVLAWEGELSAMGILEADTEQILRLCSRACWHTTSCATPQGQHWRLWESEVNRHCMHR